MYKTRNICTPFIRQCVALWFAGRARDSRVFTVSDLTADISTVTPLFKDDWPTLSKGVSNELARLERIGLVGSRTGTKADLVTFTGRPPRVYWRVLDRSWVDRKQLKIVVDDFSKSGRMGVKKGKHTKEQQTMQTIQVKREELTKDECNIVLHAPNAESYIDMVYNESVDCWEFPGDNQTKH